MKDSTEESKKIKVLVKGTDPKKVDKKAENACLVCGMNDPSNI